MNRSCTHCGTTFRIDPGKVPAGGIRARCSRCGGVFDVRADAPAAPEAAAAGAVATPAAPAPAAPVPDAPAPVAAAPTAHPGFGVADPQGRARRLARALVSDIVVYHPERRERSLRDGTLRTEFRDEIRKSWDEYVAQVGEEMARRTPYFREALNEILAAGSSVF